MNLDLEGRTALVTGAAGDSLGGAIARGLAAEGVQLCIAARRREMLDQAADEIAAAGGKRPLVIAIDLLQEDGPARLAQQAMAALGRIDILVNAAGQNQGSWKLDAPEQKWRDEIDLIFHNIRRTSLAVVPGMIKQGWGRIISVTGHSEVNHFTGSTASKAAVHGFSKALSAEVGRHGVTVNCLAPGKIATHMLRRKKIGTQFDKAAADIPLGRWGEPGEFANVAVFLASPLASYVTGTVIPIDGGFRGYAF